MISKGLVEAGWRFKDLLEASNPSILNPSRCARCRKALVVIHLLHNPFTREHISACAACASWLVPGYDGAAMERGALDYLDRELVFLNPKCWRNVRGKPQDLERYVMIGGIRWLVTVEREKDSRRYRVVVTSERDKTATAKSPEWVDSQEGGKRLAFKLVNRMRNVIRDCRSEYSTGEEFDGESQGF